MSDYFKQLEKIPSKELMPGFHGKFLHLDSMTIAFWEIKAGSILPEHHHVNDQSTNVLTGEMELTVGDETQVAKNGVPVIIPGNVPHSGKTLTDCTVLDIFSPARPEYNSFD